MEFKDLPVPFQEMASNVVRSQLATLDLSTVEKETIDTISGNVRRAFIGLYEEKRLFGGQNSTENKNQANDEKLKHIIALLLEDAKRLQQLEPNAGTEARIWIAMKSLKCESSDYFKTTIKTTQLSGELLKKLP
ncbi:hypothetical protein V5J22_004194 [Escherichia coli]|uniref:hypothetical protein n=1 Tax=Enterobacterales TaxID=91347 RepID=UPI0002A259D4|nr:MULTISPECIES: hypothetical protein [Enterobacterales]EAB0960033.1 hypothetical protein [Escherichia coli]EES4408441.1 hypothetical protein [Escherichia coli]EEW0351982.1 hypothetical protein [Escherichia coli]EFA6252431.1 hypothetical protein [Escherichia coli]EFB2116689.1 hypothetical protein [Escherichia coli]